MAALHLQEKKVTSHCVCWMPKEGGGEEKSQISFLSLIHYVVVHVVVNRMGKVRWKDIWHPSHEFKMGPIPLSCWGRRPQRFENVRESGLVLFMGVRGGERGDGGGRTADRLTGCPRKKKSDHLLVICVSWTIRRIQILKEVISIFFLLRHLLMRIAVVLCLTFFFFCLGHPVRAQCFPGSFLALAHRKVLLPLVFAHPASTRWPGCANHG